MISEHQITKRILELRKLHPRMGTRKLQYCLWSKYGLKIGRDSLYNLLRERGILIVRKRRKYPRNVGFGRYGNKLSGASDKRVISSDITYLRAGNKEYYLALTLDNSSRKIVGYNLSDSMVTEGALSSARMAVRQGKYDIHHSDGGCQYSSHKFRELMEDQGIEMSMSRPGSPHENGMIERVNGILKNEYILLRRSKNYEELLRSVRRAIRLYNEHRPHLSLNFMTPSEAHRKLRYV